MGKKKNKNQPTIDVAIDTGGGPPADPDVPDLPTPKVNVHVTSTNNNQNDNANANVNGNTAGAGAAGKNPSVHLHHDHAHNHHHSHYARSVDRDSAGGEKVTERREVVVTAEDGDATTTVVQTKQTTHAGSIKVPTVKALSSIAPVPGSPAGSVRSLKSQARPPDVIVNIAIPQQAAAAPAPAPVIAPPAPPVIAPNAVPLPPSIPPSPTPSIRSLKPVKSMKAPDVVRVKAVPIPEEPEGVEEETTVVTTTRTVRKTATPPKVPSPPLAAPAALPATAAPLRPGTPLVINDPTFLPLPDPLPRAASTESRHSDMIERTVTETVSYPVKEKKGSFLDKFKMPKFIKPTDTGPGGSPPRNAAAVPPPGDGHITVHVHGGKKGGVDVEVDTAATTIGGPTTKGITGARTAALGSIKSEPDGTKAGLRPIPIIDYKSLITQTPPRRRATLPPEPTIVRTSPPAPKTIMTMSAELDRDSKGHEHMHARLRDHSHVVKPEKVVAKKTSKEKNAGGVDVHVDVDGHHVDVGIDEGIETKKEKKEREKREKEARKEPLYKPLRGAYPPPMSERYAMPPALEDIQNSARARYERRANPGMGMPMGMVYGGGGYMGGGPPFPPPMPPTMPRPPAFMGQRPPMYGGSFSPYPIPGMGMPVNNSVMGMGMGGMGYGMGMPSWNGAGYGFMGNPRFPKGPGM